MSKSGKRKYNVIRLIEGQWVFGGICCETRDFFLVPEEDRSAETLLGVIQQYIRRHDHNIRLLESLRLLRKRRL